MSSYLRTTRFRRSVMFIRYTSLQYKTKTLVGSQSLLKTHLARHGVLHCWWSSRLLSCCLMKARHQKLHKDLTYSQLLDRCHCMQRYCDTTTANTTTVYFRAVRNNGSVKNPNTNSTNCRVKVPCHGRATEQSN